MSGKYNTPLLVAVAIRFAIGSPCVAQIGASSTVVFLDEITTGLTGVGQFAPTELVALGDGSGRLAVSTLGGTVRLIDSTGGYLDSDEAPYIGVNSVTGGGAYGTTGFAVHPDFGDAAAPGYGKIYTIVTQSGGGVVDFPSPQGNGDHVDVVVEWTADDPTSNAPSFSRRDVLRFGQPHENHNVTDLAFDAAGFLYTSSGDGGIGPNNSQSLANHHGTVFRIDPLDPSVTGQVNVTAGANGRYSYPNDNPYVSDGDPATLAEAFAFGLRSPYRMNFDFVTGKLFAGDVGGGGREEVDLIEAGHNYGWPFKEGSNGPSNPAYADPVFEYGRDEGETVVGGFVYRGSVFPELQGRYIFADFGRQVTGGQAPTPTRLFSGDVDTGEIEELQIDHIGEQLTELDGSGRVRTRQFIFGFGEDELGELYLVVGDDPQFPAARDPDGRVLRMIPAFSSGIPGDVNQDGVVRGNGNGAPEVDDVAAFVVGWKTLDHETPLEQILNGDLNLDGATDLLDWHILRTNHPSAASLDLSQLLAVSVPEPATFLLLLPIVAICRLVFDPSVRPIRCTSGGPPCRMFEPEFPHSAKSLRAGRGGRSCRVSCRVKQRIRAIDNNSGELILDAKR